LIDPRAADSPARGRCRGSRNDHRGGWNRITAAAVSAGHVDRSAPPFRGTAAVAAGLVTPKTLRGPRFRRLFTGIYIRADAEVTCEVRSRAAHLLLDGRGVLGGFSAAS
jgi:hypothetical protein